MITDIVFDMDGVFVNWKLAALNKYMDGSHKNAYSIVNNTGTQFDIQVLGGLPAAGCDLEVIVFNQEPI
jgi:hypothetical protein